MPLILAVDTSAKPVSCALYKDGSVLSSFYANSGLTHSQTLLPMIENMLRVAQYAIDDLDAVAVNAGPGSFTGVRIGVSAVKGIAFTNNTPCISVSTLEAMAEHVAVSPDTAICCLMDARCQQVYTALFERDTSGILRRLTPDEALSIEQVGERLQTVNRPIALVGDGSSLCYRAWEGIVPNVYLTPPSIRYQCAAATAVVAARLWETGDTVPAEELQPIYLRLPQAERELNSRLDKQ